LRVLQSIIENFTNLANFKGRQTGFQFWSWAIPVILLIFLGTIQVIAPEVVRIMMKMQKFAIENPELATIRTGNGSQTITIEGNHPELMPDFGKIIGGMSIIVVMVFIFMAASVTRRLHDRNKSGAWGLLPIPFLVFGLVMMPRIVTQTPFDFGLFAFIFINNMLYLSALAYLFILLLGETTKGENRYGSEPKI
jgi:uncharacterized membrane protein YhaH (DUF805 family)